MKTTNITILILVFLIILMVGFFSYSYCMACSDYGDLCPDKDKPVIAQCPETKMTESCLACHVVRDGKFSLKEVAPDAWRQYPNNKTKVISIDGSEVGYYILDAIDSEGIDKYFRYLTIHKIDYAIIEIQSPGGSLFEAWRIVGLMREWKARGNVVETRVHGFAASAGFLVFISGSKGHRLVNAQAELMWHEVMTLEGYKLSTPSSKEEEARILRHLQDTGNAWSAECSNLSKKEIDKKIHNMEFWMNGKQARENGFADGFLNE